MIMKQALLETFWGIRISFENWGVELSKKGSEKSDKLF